LLPEICPGGSGRAVVHLDFAIGQFHHMKRHQCLWRALRHREAFELMLHQINDTV
jgi:hypothetical protein